VTGRVAVVTGGTGFLGAAVTRRLLAGGCAAVCIPYAVPEELPRLEGQLDPAARGRLHAVPADVTDEAAMEAFVRDVRARHGRLDILVAAVGGFAAGDLRSTPLADWERMIRLNLTSAAVACRAVLPAMSAARYGRIVCVGSRAAVSPQGGFIAYTVAKAAVLTLVQALAQEVRGDGITVNAVLPSTMDTPANRAAMPGVDRSGWVSPEAVAEAIAFLASAAAAAVTGAALTV
jgi:NAD(P)-dependent dehydrogenase (short-subunit alcohol dehydrogenase family)